MNKLVVQTQRYKMYLAHKRFINKRSISRICKRLQQKYKTGVESYKTPLKLQILKMTSLKLKNNLPAFSDTLKNIFNNDKKARVYIQI